MAKLDLSPLEFETLDWLLSGEDPVLELLRKQLASAIAISREFTGYGFYLSFVLPENIDKLDEHFPVRSSFSFGDVEAKLASLKHGAGFLLWIKNGFLSTLEGYTYDEEWPRVIDSFELHYLNGKKRDLKKIRREWQLTSDQ